MEMAGGTGSEDGFGGERKEQIKEMHMAFTRWREGLKGHRR